MAHRTSLFASFVSPADTRQSDERLADTSIRCFSHTKRRGFYLSVFLFGIRVAVCSGCMSSIDMKWGRHFHTSSLVTADPSRTAHYYKRSSERAEMKSQPQGTCLSNKLNQRLSPSVGQLPSESRGLQGQQSNSFIMCEVTFS